MRSKRLSPSSPPWCPRDPPATDLGEALRRRVLLLRRGDDAGPARRLQPLQSARGAAGDPMSTPAPKLASLRVVLTYDDGSTQEIDAAVAANGLQCDARYDSALDRIVWGMRPDGVPIDEPSGVTNHNLTLSARWMSR